MAKVLNDLCNEDKTFFVTTMTSMLAILKVRFSDDQIKKMLTKKNIDEVLKMINEIEQGR